jgi:hypothetical protein
LVHQSVTYPSPDTSPESVSIVSKFFPWHQSNRQGRLLFLAASFLVSVPVFIQAPLVRLVPWLSIILTLPLMALSLYLYNRPKTQIWGDLMVGFTWIWLAGGLYWGWFRWEPLLHLPIESIGLPFAVWGLWRKDNIIGHFFYLGSLLGTAITDLYFYLTGLIPYWRHLMKVELTDAALILHSALEQLQTPWGISWAIVLVNLLLGVGFWSFSQKKLYWWGFSGAVLSTILVDGLFWVSATLA